MNNTLGEDFRKVIHDFVKQHHIKYNDPEFVRVLRGWTEYLSSDENHDNNFGNEFNGEDTIYKDFRNLHNDIMQSMIDYVNNHKEIQDMITKKYNEVYEDWNANNKSEYKMIPDIRFHFYADGVDESIKNGKWVPESDSSLSISVGNANIIDIM